MKKILLALLLVTISSSSFSQIYVDKDGNIHDQRKNIQSNTQNTSSINRVPNASKSNSGFDASKLTFGGSFGLQFGSYTVVNISPQVGYDFSKYFTAGAGIGYTYFKDKYSNYKWSSSYAGFNLFGRFYPTDYIVASIQPEINHMWQTIEYYNKGGKYTESEFVPSFVVGAGIRLGGMLAMIQYDIVQDNNSPYGNNIFYTIGYTFKF